MRFILILGGSILLVVGLISMVTPIPGGTLAITLGVGMIICASERAAAFIKKGREKYLRLNQVMTWMENKMGLRLSSPLRRTRPAQQSLSAELSEIE